MNHLTVRQTRASELATAAPPLKKTAAVATQAFMDELSHTFVEARSKFSVQPNNSKRALGVASSQTNVTGQNSVTASDAVTPAIGFNALVPKASTVITPPPPSAPVVTDPVQSADDAYWAKQPSAVRQLRSIDDYSQRVSLGALLASEGYSIDTPVMVWGWDPGKTTQLRQQFGYTWVPSAMQSPVTAAPGISGAGITPYDPAHPPVGSIHV
jgi:hypothetical protein